jgi:hypothetical protein
LVTASDQPWGHVGALLADAAAGADTADVAVALRMVLSIEGVEFRRAYSATEVDMTNAAHKAPSVRHAPAHCESLAPLKEDAAAGTYCAISTAGETLKR